MTHIDYLRTETHRVLDLQLDAERAYYAAPYGTPEKHAALDHLSTMTCAMRALTTAFGVVASGTDTAHNELTDAVRRELEKPAREDVAAILSDVLSRLPAEHAMSEACSASSAA
jgi:hypothetical protein